MATNPIVLSTTTLRTVIGWRQAEPHPVLADIPAWRDEAAEQALDERAHEELHEAGLHTGDALTRSFEELLDVLIRPDQELYGWIDATIEGRPTSYGVLAAATYRSGFVLAREHSSDTTVLVPVRADELLDNFVSQIPPATPARGTPVTLPYEDLAALTAPSPSEGFSGFGTPEPVNPDARALRRILAQPRTGAGNLYSARRSTNGTRLRIDHPINYIDTADGRWLTHLHTEHGRRWATITPATSKLIATRLGAGG